MAITVTLYSFTKRENSTKRPTSGGTDYSCVLIDETSLMNPTFKLEIGSNPIGKNYAYVSDFNRYYFITDITSSQNFWYISCTCDVLASFKTEIGVQSHYILRADSEYDGNITDNVYPAKSSCVTYIDNANNNYDPIAFSHGHCYVVGIVGYSDEAIEQFGAIRYYVMQPGCLKSFMSYLMNNIATGTDPWGEIATTEYSEGVQKALINPIQYIKSCVCMPVDYADITGDRRRYIRFGYYTYEPPQSEGFYFKVVNDTVNVVSTKENTYFTKREHPLAATRGAYLNRQPFTKYTLHYGPWGDIDIDPMYFKGSTLRLEILYDLVGAVARLLVKDNLNSTVLFNGSVKIGVDVNLSQVYKDALGYESATTKTLFGAISAGSAVGSGTNPVGDIASGLGFITSGIQDMTRLNYPTVSGVGSSGSYMAFKDPNNLYLLSKFMDIVDENRTEIGRPLCKVRQINTLSGYILCDKADAEITGTQDEAIKINGYLNSGFFYE